MKTLAAVFGVAGIVIIATGLLEAALWHRPAWTLALVAAGGTCSAACYLLGEWAARRNGERQQRGRRCS